MLRTHARLCHFMVRTVLTVAGYWAVSSVSAFLPCKLMWDQMAVAHSQSCTLGYMNLLSWRLRRASCQACLEGICSKTRHKLHFESITRSGRFTGPEKSRKREWDCAAWWLWLWVRSPWVGCVEPLVHQKCLGLMQWLPGVTDGKEHWQRHREIRPRTCLCKDFLQPASPNYTFIVPFCTLNSNLQILNLIMVVF